MKITFLGATGTVTGSKYLVEYQDIKILIDCGLFQGHKELRLRNWEKLPVKPIEIDAVILTHAHLDHSGYIPLFIRNGFQGKIYSTEATYDLCKILLPDSAYIQESDAERANRYHYTKHNPAKPLYTIKEAKAALKQFKPVSYGNNHKLTENFSFILNRSGHILGSSFVTLKTPNRTVVFSGDIGRSHNSIMKNPSYIQDADYLILESTYGDRLHEKTDPVEELKKIINETVAHGGKIIIPAFAVGRAQEILYCIDKLKKDKAISANIPIYLDSPMSINVTSLLCKYPNEHRLSPEYCKSMCNVAKYTRTVEESKAIIGYNGPSVIISASGMATGGRILHHFKAFIGDNRNTIVFTGFQAGGTRGDRILRGEKEIKIHGAMYPVRARIEELGNMSAHGDYEEITNWLGHFNKPPIKTFITHGESSASLALQKHLKKMLNFECTVPEYLQTVTL
jgi:metallo-beta-lactamase family protein